MARRRRERQDVPRFSRRWWLGAARTFAWVAVVTFLIWLYADMEVTRQEQLTLTIRLTTGNAPDLVLLSQKQYRVTFVVRGIRAGLNRFVSKYSNAAITFDVSKSYGPGQWAIPTLDILNQATDIVEFGVTAQSASPTAISGVLLDRRIHRQVPVRLDYINAKLEEQPSTMVGITLAASQWAKIDEEQRFLKTVRVDLQSRPTGTPIEIKAPIIAAMGGVEVELEGGREVAEFTVVIKERTRQQVVSVPVQVLVPSAWLEDGTWQQYVLKRTDPDQWRQKEIVFTGPVQELDKLKRENIHAYIVLTDEDIQAVGPDWKAPIERKVEVRVLEDLNVKVDQQPTVKFILERVPPPGPP